MNQVVQLSTTEKEPWVCLRPIELAKCYFVLVDSNGQPTSASASHIYYSSVFFGTNAATCAGVLLERGCLFTRVQRQPPVWNIDSGLLGCACSTHLHAKTFVCPWEMLPQLQTALEVALDTWKQTPGFAYPSLPQPAFFEWYIVERFTGYTITFRALLNLPVLKHSVCDGENITKNLADALDAVKELKLEALSASRPKVVIW